MSDKIKVSGYSQKIKYDDGIQYRPFSPDLVGNQLTSDGGTPLFTMGNFSITTNLDPKLNKTFITNDFSNFTSLNDLDLTLEQAKTLLTNNTGVILNLDKTNLKNYSLFGSLSEFIRVTLEEIITKWPASLYANPLNYNANFEPITGYTYNNYVYDVLTDTSTFMVNTNFVINNFQINYLTNGTILDTFSESNDMRNLTVNYLSYVIFVNGIEYPVLGFTGSTYNKNDFMSFNVKGNPFSGVPENASYHIKPSNLIGEVFFNSLSDFASYLLNRLVTPIYTAKFTYPVKSETGIVLYVDKSVTWPVSDGYNIDFESGEYVVYATELFDIATNSDLVSSNLMNRFLVSESITSFDTQPIILADEHMDSSGQKVNKTLNIYGQEFDDINKFIVGISFAHTVSYDKLDNTPDIYLKDLARIFGWGLISSVVENDLLTNYVKTSQSTYSGHSVGLTPVEADIELWRRLIINSPWIWKSKGARKSVEFLLRFIGTPKGLTQFNEHIYRVDGPVDVELFTKVLELNGLDPDLSLYPIDDDGYPRFFPDTDDMYFQNNGLWYRETGGPDSVIDILTGNNPHVGPYDGGYKYLNQLVTLIPDFSAVTITAETISSGITNLFTNYYLGDITSYTGETYVDIINIDGKTSVNGLNVVATIIDDPRASIELTPCGCVPASADDALSVCIKLADPVPVATCSTLAEPPTPDDQNGYYIFKKYQYNEDGSVFTQNGNPVLETTRFIDRQCCTGLNGGSLFTDFYDADVDSVDSGYVCCHSNTCSCSAACNWYIEPTPVVISGVNYLHFKTLYGTSEDIVVFPDASNCPTMWTTAVPNITDPYTGMVGIGCMVKPQGMTDYSIMVDYFFVKANGGKDGYTCCAFTPERYLFKPVVIPINKPIIAVNDTYTAALTEGIDGYNILVNDTLDGNPATVNNVDIVQINSESNLARIDITTGKIIVNDTIAAGTYTITYKICEKANSSNCSNVATVTIVIKPFKNNNCLHKGDNCTDACNQGTVPQKYVELMFNLPYHLIPNNKIWIEDGNGGNIYDQDNVVSDSEIYVVVGQTVKFMMYGTNDFVQTPTMYGVLDVSSVPGYPMNGTLVPLGFQEELTNTSEIVVVVEFIVPDTPLIKVTGGIN